MTIISTILNALASVFRFHKKKVLFFIGSVIFCFVALFPYDDLGELVTHKVSVLTNNDVYLQFDGLSFGFLPQLGLKMSKVIVESKYAPSLPVDSLGLAPKFSSLIFGTPGGKISAEGLFGGDINIAVGGSNKLEIDGQELGIDIDADNVDLKKLTKFLKVSYKLPFEATGKTNIDSLLHIDPLFKTDPKGTINLTLKNLVIPPTSFLIGGVMNYSLPGIKLSKLTLKGIVQEGRFIIKEGKLGDPKNDLYGDITGDLIVHVRPGPSIKLGGYDLKLDLHFSENLRKQLDLVLSVIDGYQGIGKKFRSESLKGVRYKLGLSTHSLSAPPKVSTH